MTVINNQQNGFIKSLEDSNEEIDLQILGFARWRARLVVVGGLLTGIGQAALFVVDTLRSLRSAYSSSIGLLSSIVRGNRQEEEEYAEQIQDTGKSLLQRLQEISKTFRVTEQYDDIVDDVADSLLDERASLP